MRHRRAQRAAGGVDKLGVHCDGVRARRRVWSHREHEASPVVRPARSHPRRRQRQLWWARRLVWHGRASAAALRGLSNTLAPPGGLTTGAHDADPYGADGRVGRVGAVQPPTQPHRQSDPMREAQSGAGRDH